MRRGALGSCASRMVSSLRGLAAASALCFGFAGTTLGGDIEFRTHVLDAEVEFMAAAATDVNHDGRLDVIAGGFWYEAPNWTKHRTRDVEVLGGRPDGYAHQLMDVNNDGWMDVIVVNWRSRSLQWVEHPGAGLGEWKVHLIEQPGNMESGRLVDLDADGVLDILPSGASFASWWELKRETTPEGLKISWVRNTLPQEIVGHGIGFGDVNSDGRIDIVGPNGWAEAPEDRRRERWVFHEEFFLGGAPVPVLVQDVDGDGDNDIVTTRAHDFGVYWFENTGTSTQREWVKHVIDTSWGGAHAPLWGDLDGDGRGELILGKRYLAHEGRDPGEYDPLYGYRYEFDPQLRTWRRYLLTYNEGVGFGLDPKIADLDADGDLDLLLSGRHGLYWLENLGRPHAADAVLADSPQAAPNYDAQSELLAYKSPSGDLQPVKDAFQWGQRRAHITAGIARTIGGLPGPHERVPLRPEVVSRAEQGGIVDRTLRVHISPEVSAEFRVLTPVTRTARLPGAVVVGDQGNLAATLVGRGIMCVVVNAASAPADDLRRSVWTVIRACDLLETLPESDTTNIAVVGHGTIATLAAALDQRIRAVAADDALMAASQFEPRDVLATLAPRPLRIVSVRPAVDEGTRKLQAAVDGAKQVYALRQSPNSLTLEPAGDAPLPQLESQTAAWIEAQLRPAGGARGRGGRGGRGRGPVAE